MMKAQSEYARKENSTQINLALAQDLRLASVFRRGISDFEQLDQDEMLQFNLVMGEYVSTLGLRSRGNRV